MTERHLEDAADSAGNPSTTSEPDDDVPAPKTDCLLTASEARLKARATTYKIELSDLASLIAATEGRCMICRRCLAILVDQGRSGEAVRGIVCRWCRTRLTTVDGAGGNRASRSGESCRCNQRTEEWRVRMRLATAQYLDRATSAGGQATNAREAFAVLVRRVREDGLNPGTAWTMDLRDIPTEFWTRAAARPSPPTVSEAKSPIDRPRCSPDCLKHEQHVYIACYGKPTAIRDRDHHPDDLQRDYPIQHYVGWTTQQPPSKRLSQHGPATRRCLVLLTPGTEADEEQLKSHQRCPKCHGGLWYYQAKNVRREAAPAEVRSELSNKRVQFSPSSPLEQRRDAFTWLLENRHELDLPGRALAIESLRGQVHEGILEVLAGVLLRDGGDTDGTTDPQKSS